MKELKRIRVDNFKIEDSIKISKLDNCDNKKEKIITIEKLFEDYPKIILDDHKKNLFLNGVKIENKLENGIYRIYNKNKFLGLGIIKNNLLKRDIVLEE